MPEPWPRLPCVAEKPRSDAQPMDGAVEAARYQLGTQEQAFKQPPIAAVCSIILYITLCRAFSVVFSINTQLHIISYLARPKRVPSLAEASPPCSPCLGAAAAPVLPAI